MRAIALVAALALAVLALTFAPSGNAFAAQDIAQCNSVDNTPGLGLVCDVTVVNNLNVATGVESSTVTLKECHSAANTAPSSCTGPVTTSYNTLTTSVSQCNYALDGGGASLTCNVRVINNITGQATTAGATVNQCAGSGAAGTEPTLNCDPFPANTSSATITQCNDSANGGGAAQRVTCTVLPSTQSAQLPVTINQCNNSANGGGSLVTCSTQLTNNVRTAGSTTPVKNVLHDSKTDGASLAAGNINGPMFLGAGMLVLIAGGLLTAAVVNRKAGTRR